MWFSNPGWRGYPNHAAIDGATAPTASGWDSLGHGTDISLSTVTVPSDKATNSSSNWNMVRGTSSKTTGKWVFEVKITLVASGDIMFGLMDQTTPGGAGLTSTFNAANGLEQWDNNAIFVTGADFGGSGIGTTIAYANNDILGVTADLNAGLVSFYQNGTLLGTGNNATIANSHLVCPSAAIITNGTAVQLFTGTLNFTYPGFTPWGP